MFRFLAIILAHKQTFTITSFMLLDSGYKIKLLDCSRIEHKGTPQMRLFILGKKCYLILILCIIKPVSHNIVCNKHLS